MGVGVLIWLAIERASLHHVYETHLEFKVHIPDIDVGSDGHIDDGGDEESCCPR